MILPIGSIHAFIGVISSSDIASSSGDMPILEDPDDSGNTIVADDGDSDDGVDSILPVLDYESDGGSIGLVSNGFITPAAIYMAVPANSGRDLVDPNAQRTLDPTMRAPPGFGATPRAWAQPPPDMLSTPITATTPEDLETIRLSLQAEQDRQRVERDRIHIDITAANTISEYRNRHA
jgi:hypothetical protein